MANLIEALFRIDPTQGLVNYVNSVKPYHTKILEVLVEYIYTEQVNVTVTDRLTWNMTITRPDGDVLYLCGYGYNWDHTGIVSPELIPMSYIVSAVGKFYLDISTEIGNSVIAIIRNVTGYALSIDDPIVFDTDTVLPAGIIAGETYYVTSITPTTLEVSDTIGGTPITFTDAITLRIAPQGLLYNTFLVGPSINAFQYQALATSLSSNQLSFVDGFTVTSIDSTLNKITVASLPTPPSPGDVIYLNGNSSSIANGKYTVAGVVGLTIAVNEDIPPLTPNDGTVYTVDNFDNIPFWSNGTKVKVSSAGTLPTPLSSSEEYYFIPQATIGVFALATTRYPTSYADYIDITSIGDDLLIERAEPFTPGEYVNVTGSYMHRNDGTYIIATVEPEGANFRVSVLQSINAMTISPAPSMYDGVMTSLDLSGYGSPEYCLPVHTPDLYAATYINEKLQFTFSIDERDFLGTQVIENEHGGWGADPFGTSISLYGSGSEKFAPYTAMTDGVSTGSTTHLLLPTGFDTNYFDMGPMGEDIAITKHLQELP